MWDNAQLMRNVANRLIALSLLAILYGTAYYVVHLPGVLRLQSVRLNAAPQRVSAEELLRVLRSEVRGNLVTVDISRLRQSLEKLPWVRSVSIRREFPHGLAVQIEEHQAFARWNDGELVNQYGEAFVAESDQALPGFIGQEGTSVEIAQRYVQFSRQIDTLGLSVRQIVLSPRHDWQLRLSNGMVLELGREDMQQRLARFLAVQMTEDRRQRTEGVAYVDLRYRNGFAVRRVTSEKG